MLKTSFDSFYWRTLCNVPRVLIYYISFTDHPWLRFIIHYKHMTSDNITRYLLQTKCVLLTNDAFMTRKKYLHVQRDLRFVKRTLCFDFRHNFTWPGVLLPMDDTCWCYHGDIWHHKNGSCLAIYQFSTTNVGFCAGHWFTDSLQSVYILRFNCCPPMAKKSQTNTQERIYQ
jgi:hypothetical protein